VGKELVPGITLAEVHPRYVMLSDGGVMKRLDLAPDTKGAAPMGVPGGPGVQGSVNATMPATLPPGAPVPEPPMSPGAVVQPQQVPPAGPVSQSSTFPDQGNPGQVSGPPEEPAPATPNIAVPNTANNPNNPNKARNPAPGQVQMAPPTRSTGSPVSGPAPTRQ
jgi:general secretion pathway protein C